MFNLVYNYKVMNPPQTVIIQWLGKSFSLPADLLVALYYQCTPETQCLTVKIFKNLEAESVKNTALWVMVICSLVESNEDSEEANCSQTKVRIVKVQQNVPHMCP